MPDTSAHVSPDAPPPQSRAARFERLAELVYEPLQRFARRRIDTEHVDDIVADALLVAWRRLDEIPTGAELPWCYGVARRCLANQRRSVARHARLVDRMIADARTDGPVAAGEQANDELDIALAALRDDDRELLELWAWERLEPREIAEVLGMSPNAVSIRLHRAKQRLRELLEQRKDTPVAGHGRGGTAREDR